MTQTTQSFSLDDQLWFASVSGDANPLHVDPEFAARTYPGYPVVHGLHLVLWGLEQLAVDDAAAVPTGFKVNFTRPVIVGDEVAVDLSQPSAVRLRVRGEAMATIKLTPGRAPERWANDHAPRPPSDPPQDWGGASLDTAAGALAMPQSGDALQAQFPNLAAILGADVLRGLVGISTIIGMEAPGLNGMLTEFSVAFSGDVGGDHLAYRTLSHHPVFNRVELAFQGLGVIGKVAATLPRFDSSRRSPAGVRRHVTAGEFAGQRPLVIGASSGLGSVTALLIAAGGGRPLLGYTRAPDTLDETIGAIQAIGGECDAVRIDVKHPEAIQPALAAIGWTGREAYYFASPRIFRRRIEPFQVGDFTDFNAYFVTGFYEVMRALIAHQEGKILRVLYPSSSAIDEDLSQLLEYSLSKGAGEKLCATIQAASPAVDILTPRFGRIATRQTTTALQVEAADAEDVMMPIIRRMQGSEPLR